MSINNDNLDPCTLWDLLKYNIRKITVKYSKNKAREIRKREQELLHTITILEHNLYLYNSPDIRASLKKAQDDLMYYYNLKLQGTIIRSRARWVEEGEKSTKYFLNLENRNKVNNSIHNIKNDNGMCITERSGILEEIKSFYVNLYTSSNTSPDIFFDNLDSNHLSIDESLSCEGTLTYNECTKALFSMSNDKSPGSDGISVNFYKSFWHLIGNLVVDSLNWGYNRVFLYIF